MRFGCCLNMVATKPDKTGMEWIEKLAEYGFDYAELPIAQLMELSDGDFETLKKRLKATGIQCETGNNLFPVTMRLTGPDTNIETIKEYAEKAFFKEASLGVEYCVFGSGPAKNVPDGFPKEKGLSQVVSMLREIAGIAQKNGIGIVIEPLRKEECNLINTFEEGVELARAVNEENVKVLIDFYHLTEEKESVSHIVKDGREFLRHVHIANPVGRVYPKVFTEADYGPFIEALHTVGYDARISCEAYSLNGFDKDAPAAVEFFRQYFV